MSNFAEASEEEIETLKELKEVKNLLLGIEQPQSLYNGYSRKKLEKQLDILNMKVTAYVNARSAVPPVQATEYTAVKKSPSSKRVRADLTLIRGDKRVKIENILVDGGYSETLCIQPKFAKELGLKKKKKPQHNIILGNGRIAKEYAYDLDDKEFIVCELEFKAKEGRKSVKETATCAIRPFYHDSSDNILGAEAISSLRLCVIAGKGVRKAIAHKC